MIVQLSKRWAFTLKMASAMTAETLEEVQRTTQLKPKSRPDESDAGLKLMDKNIMIFGG